ncbi:MAG: formylglycine-generating enzyme family protein [Pseudomonadota bacterium]
MNGIGCSADSVLPDTGVDAGIDANEGDGLKPDTIFPDAQKLDMLQQDTIQPDMLVADAPSSDYGQVVVGTFVTISAGTFTMGSPPSEACRGSNETQHQVTLTNDFEISKYEVTQQEFQALMGYNPSYFLSCGNDCPVEQVNWHQAAAYCNALSTQKGYSQCYACTGGGPSITCSEALAYSGQNIYRCSGYRLPTEAEWEYAYRAGTTTAFYSGGITSCSSDLNANDIGWYVANSGGKTHPVGLKQANTWGLYDMAGNAWEWCHDWYGTYGSSAATDPWGTSISSGRVLRGGTWKYNAKFMRAASRYLNNPPIHSDWIGFRPCRTK